MEDMGMQNIWVHRAGGNLEEIQLLVSNLFENCRRHIPRCVSLEEGAWEKDSGWEKNQKQKQKTPPL